MADEAPPETTPPEDQQPLEVWVKGLVARHGLGNEIPRCWQEHGGLVDELAALQAAEARAMNFDNTVPPNWFQQLRELVNWTAGRTAGRCAREDWHHPDEGWAERPDDETVAHQTDPAAQGANAVAITPAGGERGERD